MKKVKKSQWTFQTCLAAFNMRWSGPSLAAGSTNWLAPRQPAKDNIRETTERLESQSPQEQQNAVSNELFDVVAGFRAQGERGGK
ncbi:MAG: hypothetical protein JXR72_04185 [Proteobacteria bacterium]|nr:hypothetical protein [Pseudomonadota bacterium]